MSRESSQPVDKDFLYGRFQKSVDWQQKLAKKASYKALDIADDDMNITANKTGLGGGAIAAIVAAAGLGPALMGAMLFLKQPSPAQATQPIKEVIDNTVDKSIEVKSYVEQE